MKSSEEAEQESEVVSRCMDEDLTHSFEVVLKDLPEVLMYIKRLNEHIQKQQKTLVKLFAKLKEYVSQSPHVELWLSISEVMNRFASKYLKLNDLISLVFNFFLAEAIIPSP